MEKFWEIFIHWNYSTESKNMVNIFFKIKVNKEINIIYFPFELKFSSI